MIIGISGKKQAGKDTIGKIIQYLIMNSKHGNDIIFEGYNSSTKEYKEVTSGWSIKWFAEPLKDIVCILLGCTRQQLEDNAFKEKELGEEWVRWVIYYNEFHKIVGIYETEEEAYEMVKVHYKSIENFNDKSKYPHARVVKEYLTPRKLLQLMGTECGRQIVHPNIWVNALMSNYKSIGGYKVESSAIKGMEFTYKDGSKHIVSTDFPLPEFNRDNFVYPNWIITDVRFPNEVEAIKDRGGIIIRVNRTSWLEEKNNGDGTITLSANRQMLKIDLHESETALDNYTGFNYGIENDSSIEKLIDDVRMILRNERII